ncbi:Na+/H+ antiporter NhaA [Arcticibacter tournemirensis]|uniref:Na(+)/H(+) antiporter NhaA n=1 Tax=Arcticibacter tournemirensis TaxID=699437 RepID=A0A4V1KIK6_9SPHI|nr:Na+/H+ antiporter NhaA [Arcticibacter tournemirensis]RXF71022.1 Na+/H+ antiporter NhaA [Arcticibacter tournemirensis]
MSKLINFRPFRDFLRSGQIGGIILMLAVIISLIIANSPWREGFTHILEFQIGKNVGNVQLRYPLELWINDGLMAVFFLLVGLEIKREILEGELSSPKKAAMPVFAALGGMLIPAGIFLLINGGSETSHGWGIPMATDIAFALAIISLLGKRVPTSLKIFLAALAIVDDLGAILVIAVFYTSEVHLDQLLYSGIILALLTAFNLLGVKKLIFYIIPGFFLWYFVHHSGIHATIAGVLLAFTIPTNPVKAASPLEKLEHSLTAPVNYFIMPIFALANTNIHFEDGMVQGLASSLGLGIIGGLVLGKTIGITLFSYLSVKLGFASLPSRSGWKHIIGLGMLGGIGFTMSVFIALLSFDQPEFQAEAKFSILIASLIAGISGYLFLNSLYKKRLKKILVHKNC